MLTSLLASLLLATAQPALKSNLVMYVPEGFQYQLTPQGAVLMNPATAESVLIVRIASVDEKSARAALSAEGNDGKGGYMKPGKVRRIKPDPYKGWTVTSHGKVQGHDMTARSTILLDRHGQGAWVTVTQKGRRFKRSPFKLENLIFADRYFPDSGDPQIVIQLEGASQRFKGRSVNGLIEVSGEVDAGFEIDSHAGEIKLVGPGSQQLFILELYEGVSAEASLRELIGHKDFRVLEPPQYNKQTGRWAASAELLDPAHPFISVFIAIPVEGGHSVVVTGSMRKQSITPLLPNLLIPNFIKTLRIRGRAPPKPQVTAAVQRWQRKIGGRKLEYYRTTSYSSHHRVLRLCSNGRFRDSAEGGARSGGYSSSVSMGYADGGAGTWQIEPTRSGGAQLVLNKKDGRYVYSIGPHEQGVALDGDRWFISGRANCQ